MALYQFSCTNVTKVANHQSWRWWSTVRLGTGGVKRLRRCTEKLHRLKSQYLIFVLDFLNDLAQSYADIFCKLWCCSSWPSTNCSRYFLEQEGFVRRAILSFRFLSMVWHSHVSRTDFGLSFTFSPRNLFSSPTFCWYCRVCSSAVSADTDNQPEGGKKLTNCIKFILLLVFSKGLRVFMLFWAQFHAVIQWRG